MVPPRAFDRDVVALRFDESAVADELATWCGGKVTWAPAEDGSQVATIWVPTERGPRPALLGDWIVRRGDDDYLAYAPEDFAARFEPSHARIDELGG